MSRLASKGWPNRAPFTVAVGLIFEVGCAKDRGPVSKSAHSAIEDLPMQCYTPARLIIPIDLRLLKVTMPTTTSTIVDQISAEKTKISERLARLDADREKIATQLTD